MGIFTFNKDIIKENFNSNTLPNIMYFSSSHKIDELKGRVFLSPLIGISSMFIVDKKDIKSIMNSSCNVGYLEWDYPDNKLKEPLKFVHITHTLKERTNIEKGESSGYIYKIDISEVKNKMSLFVTKDPKREIIYNGEEPLNIIEVIPWKLKWTCQYDQKNVDEHGYGTIKEEYIFNEKDFTYNFDKWENKEVPILFINGLMGSGKSTLGKKLAEKYNAEYIELDLLNWEFKKKYGDKFSIRRNPEFVSNCYIERLNNIYIKSNKQIIAEGTQILRINFDFIIQNAVYIVKTSYLNSFIRTQKRQLDPLYIERHGLSFRPIFFLKGNIKNYNDIKELENKLKEISINIDDHILQEQYIINESTTSQRFYKCPYCDYRNTRENLVYHVDDVHKDLIPENYTAARIIFNYINKKNHGTCIIDKAETEWDEQRWRYQRLCGKKSCYEEYKKLIDGRMLKKWGTTKVTYDPEFQKKMLANRKISGEYKFADGGVRSYCGSYEQKLLEFYDIILHEKSDNIITPGPTIEYEFEGKKLYWITDGFYVPFNLVIDVKDGGDNPNNRPMEEYRAKQIAKEKAIAELKQYNYIRLTNNNFDQLLYIMAEIKKQLKDYPDSEDVIININEYTAMSGVNPVESTNKELYIVPYMMNNSFLGTCISFDKYLSKLYRIDDNKIVKENISFLYDKDFSIYKYNGTDNISIEEGSIIDNKNKDYFYTLLTGKELLSPDQLLFDENFIEVNNPYEQQLNKIESIKESIQYEYDVLSGNNVGLPIIDNKLIKIKESKLKGHGNIDILEDINGYFVYNECTKSRSSSYKDIKQIPNEILYMIEQK